MIVGSTYSEAPGREIGEKPGVHSIFTEPLLNWFAFPSTLAA